MVVEGQERLTAGRENLIRHSLPYMASEERILAPNQRLRALA